MALSHPFGQRPSHRRLALNRNRRPQSTEDAFEPRVMGGFAAGLRLGKPGYGTPRTLSYQHLLELATLADEKGQPVKLKPGTQVEYWLEAADACDYPKPNVGESKHFKVLLTPPERDPKQQQEQRDRDDRQQELTAGRAAGASRT